MLLKLILVSLLAGTLAQYEATWDSIDSRPLPEWFDKAKIGIFIHWGVFSVPSFGNEWFWLHLNEGEEEFVDFFTKNYPPGFTYQDFAKDFTAEFFNPEQWADLFSKSGAKYVVLTSKHHEGYTLWPSKYSYSWNAVDVGPKRDLLGDLAAAVREKDLHFGVYHSLYEWFNPLYVEDKANFWQSSTFVDNKIVPEMKELINTYKPEILWSDGDWEAPDYYWKSTDFLAWLYNESPVKDFIVTNDRWGIGAACNHGGYITCYDRYLPGEPQTRKWENAMTIDIVSWGYRREAALDGYLTTQELINTLVPTISNGGNILINIGPTKEGTISPIFEERLLDLGKWLAINGEAIYESQAWTTQNDEVTPDVWYTTNGTAVYAILLQWPKDDVVVLGAVEVSLTTKINLLGNEFPLQFGSGASDNEVAIFLPPKSKVASEWAWVLRFITE